MPQPRRKPRGFQYLHTLPNEALIAALGDRRGQLNVAALSRALDKRSCVLWHYVRGRRKWPADDWLRAMIVVGAVNERRDGFEIVIPRTPELCRAFDRLRGAPFLRIEPAEAEDEFKMAAPDLPPEWEDFLADDGRPGERDGS